MIDDTVILIRWRSIGTVLFYPIGITGRITADRFRFDNSNTHQHTSIRL
jgi:hypothetical protein